MSHTPIPGFRPVPYTGVIYVMAEAQKRGWRYGHPDWANLGQGQPETGPLPGAPHAHVGDRHPDAAGRPAGMNGAI